MDNKQKQPIKPRHRIRLLTTGFVQVYFVSINTVFLAAGFIPGVAVASFLISYLSTGATLGGLLGLLTTKIFTP